MRWNRALPVFSILFPILYAPTMYYNWPVFTYVPQQGIWHLFRYLPPAAEGPPMFYYGWLVTAGVAAAVVALLVAYLPERATQRIPASLGWIAPVAVVILLLDILSPWFTHS